MWLSDIRAAETVSQKLHGNKDSRAMLLINRIVNLIVAGNALGTFTRFGNVIPFSVDLTNFCRSFSVGSNTTILIYISHDVRLINEVHNVIKRNCLFEFLTTN